MNITRWYDKVLIILLLIVLSPLIICAILYAAIASLIDFPKRIRQYKQSEYYADFQNPYSVGVLDDAKYIFYNSAKKRNLPIEYIRQKSNGFEYFIFDNILYLFPDFDQLDFKDEENEWQVDYDGDWSSLNKAVQQLTQKLERKTTVYEYKILVERRMIPQFDLDASTIPECIFVTLDYETAFENEDFMLKYKVPQNSEELYEMMLETPQLCGGFELKEDGIQWNLYENASVQIDVNPGDCYINIEKQHKSVTHWHPTCYDIYNEVLNLGLKGNILVIRKFGMGEQVLYFGKKENCPHLLTSKLLVFEAK